MFKDWNDIVKGCVQNFDNAKDVATLNCVPVIFLNIVSTLLLFAGLTALAMFILAGFKLMNSEGDAKKIEGARNNVIYGIIGLMIVLFSFLLINVISQVTGVECINFGHDGGFGFGCR
ncbi:MAG: hypothetical protein HYW62_04215 [Candidatus Levybacteria bacterium]|nr:hypothetical protein [Candidatus Levybacteria bacterium]